MYESLLDLARLLQADIDPAVEGIFAQPCRLTAGVAGWMRRHVPDFLLVMRSGTVRVVNVKRTEGRTDPKIAEALAWPGEGHARRHSQPERCGAHPHR
ncbi:hypothetical protein [Streptomyces malaysiense]|uniref:hypothetical protein n=1 Tax=Streptomyces malaysiense TaxID=1428626 RepID=UPI000B125227|nr:hypothetical protein [Streptomyces malaysiense]